MNAELGEQEHADPLQAHLSELRARSPAHTELLGGTDDPRPIAALQPLALEPARPLPRTENAGHPP
ncbi:hypothetical protein [Nocardiopsis alkaliphila]|uniref:hypothetical protein n=1 Tax=Nocardiopsis alkaliphila TaxID=225762 RepID=UPI00034A8864|nr:hypothetical protein [Nocardiopsis alkaliphila]